MTRAHGLYAAVVALTAVAAAAVPPPPGLPPGAAVGRRAFGALTAAAIAGLVAAPLRSRRTVAWWRPISALAIGVAAYAVHDSVGGRCVADYDGRPQLIGTELMPWAATYKQAHPESGNDDLLFDAGGVAQRVWTPASIDRCREQLKYTSILWLPFCASGALLFAAGALAARSSADRRLPGQSPVVESGFAYDLFLSYRHGGRDAEFTRDLVEELERSGFRVAIDERDFQANENFLSEMERCIRQSRFVAMVVSPRYLESGNCDAEAVITQTMDMAERRKRLVPLTIEQTTVPAWMYSIVGIDFTKPDPLTDPLDKLKQTLRSPAADHPKPASTV